MEGGGVLTTTYVIHPFKALPVGDTPKYYPSEYFDPSNGSKDMSQGILRPAVGPAITDQSSFQTPTPCAPTH